MMYCVDPEIFEFYGTGNTDYGKIFKIDLELCKGRECKDVKELHMNWPYLVTVTNN